jgi:hypothetical protein
MAYSNALTEYACEENGINEKKKNMNIKADIRIEKGMWNLQNKMA